MEQTTLPPLVSDQRIRDIETGKFASERMYEMNYQQGMKDMRAIYEAERAKYREVAQALVNHIAKMKAHIKPVSPPDAKQRQGVIDAYIEGDDALALAKSRLQIEPTK